MTYTKQHGNHPLRREQDQHYGVDFLKHISEANLREEFVQVFPHYIYYTDDKEISKLMKLDGVDHKLYQEEVIDVIAGDYSGHQLTNMAKEATRLRVENKPLVALVASHYDQNDDQYRGLKQNSTLGDHSSHVRVLVYEEVTIGNRVLHQGEKKFNKVFFSFLFLFSNYRGSLDGLYGKKVVSSWTALWPFQEIERSQGFVFGT